MFTGIIESLGRVVRRRQEGNRTLLMVACPDWGVPLEPGESVAADGVCLTVVRRIPGGFAADVGSETLRRTTLGEWRSGRTVNLERPLKWGDRMGGHLVQGHVDGTVRVMGVMGEVGGKRLTLELVDAFRPHVVEKGSIAINGVSLTVSALPRERFDVFLVPHTLRETNLGALRSGQRVNLELDVIGKYVERWMAQAGWIGKVPGGVQPTARKPGTGAIENRGRATK